MRPASRKFKRELDEKITRLERRIERFEAGTLEAGSNPGLDRMAEALYLRGDWSRSKSFGTKAAAYWEAQLGRVAEEPKQCEPAFHLGSSYLFADDIDAARAAFSRGVDLYVRHGLAGSDDTGYMAAVAGDYRRAEVVFHAAVVADMTAQGLGDLKAFAKRFPDTPRLLKLHFVQGMAKRSEALVGEMRLMQRWLNPEAEGVTSFRTEEWFFAAHQAVLAQLARGEAPRFRLYDKEVRPGLILIAGGRRGGAATESRP